MGLFDQLFGKPPASGPLVNRWPGGTAIVDLRNAPRGGVNDGTVLDAVVATLDQGEPPSLRVFVIPATALVAWSKNGVVMAARIRALHLASRRRDDDGKPIPDAAIVDGTLDQVGAAAYLLWALGIEPFPIGATGELPVIEARTALGRAICGVHGTPIGKQPPDPLLRKVNLARDDLEATSDAATAAGDAMANGEAVKKLLQLATLELDYISGVLRDIQ